MLCQTLTVVWPGASSLPSGGFMWYPRIIGSNLMKQTYLLRFCLPLFCLILHAQEYRGTITGLVTDPSGGRVASAEVIATNIATQVAFRSTTNESGVYTL